LDVAGIEQVDAEMQEIEGKSFSDILFTKKRGIVNKNRDHILIGKERHDVGRPNDAGYPIRGIVKGGFIYLKNFKPERWPAGNPETGYLNIDGSPTKSLIINMRREGKSMEYWKKSFGMREEEELYDIGSEPECLTNLASDAGYNALKRRMNEQLYLELLQQDDPRVYGKGDIFDKYPYAENENKDFYNKFMKGEIFRKNAGWVDSTDFENIDF
jgi:hypothetical protein